MGPAVASFRFASMACKMLFTPARIAEGSLACSVECRQQMEEKKERAKGEGKIAERSLNFIHFVALLELGNIYNM